MWGFSTFGTAKFCKPLFISAATEASNLKFVIQICYLFVICYSMPKQLFGPKLAGVWAREAPQKFWDPYIFLQLF